MIANWIIDEMGPENVGENTCWIARSSVVRILGLQKGKPGHTYYEVASRVYVVLF